MRTLCIILDLDPKHFDAFVCVDVVLRGWDADHVALVEGKIKHFLDYQIGLNGDWVDTGTNRSE